MLKSSELPVVPLGVEVSRGTRELAALREDFRKRGWYNRATRRVLLELAFHLMVVALGAVLVVHTERVLIKIFGIVLLCIGSIGIGNNTHTSSHYATSDRPWVNELLTHFGYALCLGFAATFWWKKHLSVHHRYPNVVGIDQDINLRPWFATTERDLQEATGFHEVFYRYQAWILPLALSLNGFSIQLQGWHHVLRSLFDADKRRPAHWIDLGMLCGHWLIWLAVPTSFFPFHAVVFVYIAWLVGMGYTVFCFLAPAHFPPEAICVDQASQKRGFVWLQTSTTVNFRTGWCGRLLCAGCEYQVEHHLFPQICHIYYPMMSEHVKAFCRRHGYPYHSLSWRDAVWKSFVIFRSPKKVTFL